MPGPLSATWIEQRAVVLTDGDLDPRVFAVTGVHRIVDQVAKHGHHLLAGQREIVDVRREMRLLGDGQLDAAFVGLCRLAEQQRDKRGLTDSAGQSIDQLL